MKSLYLALLEYNNTPQEFKPYLCLHPNGNYIVITFSNPANIKKLMELEVIK